MVVNEAMQERIIQISKDTGIPTKKVWDLLYFLREGISIENNQLIQKLGVSRNALNQAKQIFHDLLEEPSKNTKLIDKTIEDVGSLFGPEYKPEETLWSTLESTNYNQTIKLLKRYDSRRPIPDRRYDQFTTTVETTAKRAALLDWFGDIAGKRLLFLGDDDFTSVAAANTRKASRITVLDVDNRILDTIGDVIINENLEIDLENYDARKVLPATYNQKYDVVFTDPPYTPEGIELFVSRAVKALDTQNQSARIYICYGSSDRAKERFLPIYEVFSSSGLMTRWTFDKFNRYQEAESIGSSSSLFILDTTSKTKPLITRNYDKPIYTNN